MYRGWSSFHRQREFFLSLPLFLGDLLSSSCLSLFLGDLMISCLSLFLGDLGKEEKE